MNVLVCGGRDYSDRRRVYDVLDTFLATNKSMTLLTGGAAGADQIADDWGAYRKIGRCKFFPDWDRYGRAAGPYRNQRMLDEGKPDLVIAFPGGRGTADMVRRARAAGVPVHEIQSG